MPKTKAPIKSEPTDPTLLESTWRALFEVADDSRQELHKQISALIAFASGALAGGGRLAQVVSDRVNDLARQALAASDRTGRELVSSTRDTAQNAADRASATARTLVGTRDAA